MLARVRALLRRSGAVADDGDVWRFGRLEIDNGLRQVRLDGQPCDLTSYQFDLLCVLAQHPGRVLSRDQIMDLLKGHPWRLLTGRLMFISRIRAAIETDPKEPRRILTVRAWATCSPRNKTQTALQHEDFGAAHLSGGRDGPAGVRALVSGWLAQRHMDHERSQLQSQAVWNERAAAWAELLENSLPPASASELEQAEALLNGQIACACPWRWMARRANAWLPRLTWKSA